MGFRADQFLFVRMASLPSTAPQVTYYTTCYMHMHMHMHMHMCMCMYLTREKNAQENWARIFSECARSAGRYRQYKP